jgi:hypothetical protein
MPSAGLDERGRYAGRPRRRPVRGARSDSVGPSRCVSCSDVNAKWTSVTRYAARCYARSMRDLTQRELRNASAAVMDVA